MTPGNMWRKYRNLELWKRALLLAPVIVAIALVAVYVFVKPGESDILEDLFDIYNEQTKEKVEQAEENIKNLEKEGQQLSEQREELQKEISKNEKTSNRTDNRIDNADSFAELERIRKEIEARSLADD